jgi:phosphate:Na+ symporter
MIKWFVTNVFHTDSLARQIAMGFTFMPVINHIIIIPVLDFVVGIFEKMVPPKESEKPFSVKYLHEQLIDGSVEIALEMAKKEILIVADLVKEMFGKIELAFINKDPKIVREICETDSKVDLLHRTIILFLAKISQKEMGEDDSKRSINYLYIENELESIGDVIDKDIMVLATKMIDQDLTFSADGLKELKELHGKVNVNIARLVDALSNEDQVAAEKIKDKFAALDETRFKRLHIERLQKGLKESIGTSSVHLDLINYFNRVNEHVAYIAGRILWLVK